MDSIFQKVLGAVGIAAVLGAFAVSGLSGVSAEEKAKKPPACSTIKDEATCASRDDCTWVPAVIDSKTQKEKKRAVCKAKPKSPPKKT